MNKPMEIKSDGDRIQINQDVDSYRDYAKRSRDINSETGGSRYRSFAIIPDIVALDIFTKYNINIHAEDFLSDVPMVNKLKRIIRSEYPDLLTY